MERNTVVFNEKSSYWEKNRDVNKVFLQCQQAYLNHRLQTYGHLFLNEVHDALGLPRTCEGQLVGWVLDGEETQYVSFGMEEVVLPNGNVVFVLRFNVDGIILHLVNWEA